MHTKYTAEIGRFGLAASELMSWYGSLANIGSNTDMQVCRSPHALKQTHRLRRACAEYRGASRRRQMQG